MSDSDVSRSVSQGVERWVDSNNQFHNVNDRPAVVFQDGTRMHYRHGVLHRDGDKPAVYNADVGDQQFFINGRLHRDDDKPALITVTMRQVVDKSVGVSRNSMTPPPTKNIYIRKYGWYQNGVQTRDGGKPAHVIYDGSEIEIVFYEDGSEVGGKSRVVRDPAEARELFNRYVTQALEDDEPEQEVVNDSAPEPEDDDLDSTTESKDENDSTGESEDNLDPTTESSKDDDESSVQAVKEPPVSPRDPLEAFVDYINDPGRDDPADFIASNEDIPLTELLVKKIFQHRKDNGPFKEFGDLSKVKGLGGTTLSKLETFIKSAAQEVESNQEA